MRLFVNLLFGLLDGRSRRPAFWFGGAFSVEALPHQLCNRLVDRAGVRLLFGDADFGQHFYNHVRWNLQLPRQLVDTDFAHIWTATLL
jgi:hypothetical protein